MEKTPNPNSTNSEFRIAALNKQELEDHIFVVETKLNDTVMTDDDERLYINDATEELYETFGHEYFDLEFDIIGHAYIGDRDGDLTGEERLVASDRVLFSGISIITPLTNHEVVFQFDYVGDEVDETVTIETYFFKKDNMLKCLQRPEAENDENEENENLVHVLHSFALRSAAMMTSEWYLSGNETQKRILREDTALEAAEYTLSLRGGDLLAVDTDEYSIISDNTDDSGDVPSNTTTPAGRLIDITFIEPAFDNYGENMTRTIEETCPSLVLRDEVSNVLFLVPIRSVKSIHPITDGDRY